MAYIKISDTDHGELGHNGWAYVLNHPYAAEDQAHPAYYEETGLLTRSVSGAEPQVKFGAIHGVSRGGVKQNAEIYIPVTEEQAAVAADNRKAYDADHKPAGGWRVIID